MGGRRSTAYCGTTVRASYLALLFSSWRVSDATLSSSSLMRASADEVGGTGGTVAMTGGTERPEQTGYCWPDVSCGAGQMISAELQFSGQAAVSSSANHLR